MYISPSAASRLSNATPSPSTVVNTSANVINAVLENGYYPPWMTPLRNHPFVASTTLFFIGWPEIFIFVFLLVIVVYFTAMLCIIGFATGAIRERSPTGAFQSSYFAAALPVQAFVGLARSSGFKGILPTWVKISPILGVFSALLLALGTYILYGEFVDL